MCFMITFLKLVRLFWLNLWINETKYYSKNTFPWMWCLLINFLIMVSSVHGGKIVWCLLSTVEKLSGVFCPRWQKMWCLLFTLAKIAWWLLGLVSFVLHSGWAGSIGAYKTPCFDPFQQSEYTFLDYLFYANFGTKIK